MMKLLTVIGARPQIIKAAALSRAIRGQYQSEVEEKILHTGQHYDANMSQVFFDELEVPRPDYNLGVGSGSHGAQTAKMMAGIEEVLLAEHFDGMVLYGDTNSTLAGAVAAAKLHVPVFHIEAGLRMYDLSNPEEQNRVVCDNLSNILFAPTQTAMDNLRREGFFDNSVVFQNGKGRKIINSGDVMYDNSLHFAPIAEQRCCVLDTLGIKGIPYVLATIHRDNNTDQPSRLTAIFRALVDIAEAHAIPIIIPLHPRTSKLLDKNLDSDVLRRLKQCPYIHIIPPASFFEIIELERHAQMVMTDSGGVQKEAFFYGRPTVVFMAQTAWTEIVQYSAGVLVDADYNRIMDGYENLAGREVHFPPLFGDGHAAECIVQEIIQYLT